MGHLIDSGNNNLQRFIEIQFEEKPYKIRHYDRVEYVKVNDYQNAEIKEIIDFLMSINNRIKKLMAQQTTQTLNYKIELYDDHRSDLRFLMTDYVDHFEHHVKQITQN
ncbi:MAG: DinB family protein [Saprospiraceae bacterium]